MDMSKTFTVTADYNITSDNEFWRMENMEEGIPSPEVTGGMITTPQGTKKPSKAAITGGVFTEGAEAATYADENSRKIIDSLFSSEVSEQCMALIENPAAVIQELEFFFTNVVKNEYQKIAGEFSDNELETQATEQVINSLKVKITINGLPTKEEIIEMARQTAIEEINKVLVG